MVPTMAMPLASLTTLKTVAMMTAVTTDLATSPISMCARKTPEKSGKYPKGNCTYSPIIAMLKTSQIIIKIGIIMTIMTMSLMV